MKITINETEYGIYWGLNTIDRFCDMVDMDMTSAITLLMQKDSGIKGTVVLAKFITCAVDTDAIINDLSAPAIPYQKIIVEIDKKGADFTTPIVADFFNSYLYGKSVAELMGVVLEETNKTGAKKKSVSRKSSSLPTK
jgi:hypothetical protein